MILPLILLRDKTMLVYIVNWREYEGIVKILLKYNDVNCKLQI